MIFQNDTQLRTWLHEQDGTDTVMIADGWAQAMVGLTNDELPRLVYSVTRIVRTLVVRDGLSPDEAQEHFESNIAGAYVGPQTPLYIGTP